MAHCNTTLDQIPEIFPKHEFEALSKMYPTEVKMRTFSMWTQFVAMLSAQLAGLDSLKCITDVFDTQESKLYHWGMRKFSRSTLECVYTSNIINYSGFKEYTINIENYAP